MTACRRATACPSSTTCRWRRGCSRGCGVWTDASGPSSPRASPPGPRLQLSGREHLLLTGPLQAALEIGHRPTQDWFVPRSPNLFWPADRSWCVGTDVDLTSTVVGGDTGLVADVLADPGLDAWPVEASDDVSLPGDTVNV